MRNLNFRLRIVVISLSDSYGSIKLPMDSLILCRVNIKQAEHA